MTNIIGCYLIRIITQIKDITAVDILTFTNGFQRYFKILRVYD